MNRDINIEKIFKQIDSITAIRINLSKESDRGCSLFSVSYLDKLLNQCIQNFLVDDKNIVNEILGTGRALGSFSNRIDMSYLLGIISAKQRRDLHLIRKVRNEFGHSCENISFETNSIKNRVIELGFNKFKYKNMRDKFIKEVTLHMGILAAYTNLTAHIQPRKDENDNDWTEYIKENLNNKQFLELSLDNYLRMKAETEQNNVFVENSDLRDSLLKLIDETKDSRLIQTDVN